MLLRREVALNGLLNSNPVSHCAGTFNVCFVICIFHTFLHGLLGMERRERWLRNMNCQSLFSRNSRQCRSGLVGHGEPRVWIIEAAACSSDDVVLFPDSASSSKGCKISVRQCGTFEDHPETLSKMCGYDYVRAGFIGTHTQTAGRLHWLQSCVHLLGSNTHLTQYNLQTCKHAIEKIILLSCLQAEAVCKLKFS